MGRLIGCSDVAGLINKIGSVGMGLSSSLIWNQSFRGSSSTLEEVDEIEEVHSDLESALSGQEEG